MAHCGFGRTDPAGRCRSHWRTVHSLRDVCEVAFPVGSGREFAADVGRTFDWEPSEILDRIAKQVTSDMETHRQSAGAQLAKFGSIKNFFDKRLGAASVACHVEFVCHHAVPELDRTEVGNKAGARRNMARGRETGRRRSTFVNSRACADARSLVNRSRAAGHRGPPAAVSQMSGLHGRTRGPSNNTHMTPPRTAPTIVGTTTCILRPRGMAVTRNQYPSRKQVRPSRRSRDSGIPVSAANQPFVRARWEWQFTAEL